MTPHDIYVEAARRGLRLEARGAMLGVSPKGHCPPDFANVLRQHKAELLDWLAPQPCPGCQAVPPADLPLATIMPEPTLVNRERVIAYMVRQGCNRPGPLTAWLVGRENAYYDGPGRHWDCGLLAYSAARDAACWQLSRSESEVWTALEGCESAATEWLADRSGGR